MLSEPEWRLKAKCRGQPTELFVPELNVLKSEYHDYAKRLCSGCTVVLECAIDAKLHGDHGIIRAAKSLPATKRKCTEMLNRVIERGGKPPEPNELHSAPGSVRSKAFDVERAKRIWGNARCSTCSNLLRPKIATLAQMPGTVRAKNKRCCMTCHSKGINK